MRGVRILEAVCVWIERRSYQMNEPGTGYDPILFASSCELLETMIGQLAPIINTYYESLLNEGLPEELAHQLVVDWHTLWWTMMITKGMEQ